MGSRLRALAQFASLPFHATRALAAQLPTLFSPTLPAPLSSFLARAPPTPRCSRVPPRAVPSSLARGSPGQQPGLARGCCASCRVTSLWTQASRRASPLFSRSGCFVVSELFVQYLATYSYRHGRGKEERALTYNDLSNTAEESETFQFLADILPKKILASKYLKMLKEKREADEEEENETSDESDDEDAES